MQRKARSRKSRAEGAQVERGLGENDAEAQSRIMAGKVFAGERKLAKPGETIAEDQPLEVRGQDQPWVSRGGLKLAHALEHFHLGPAGRVCLHVGRSEARRVGKEGVRTCRARWSTYT